MDFQTLDCCELQKKSSSLHEKTIISPEVDQNGSSMVRDKNSATESSWKSYKWIFVILFSALSVLLIIVLIFAPKSDDQTHSRFDKICMPAGLDFDNTTFLEQEVGPSEIRPFVLMCRNARGMVVLLPELPKNRCYPNPVKEGAKIVHHELKKDAITLEDLGYQPVYNIQTVSPRSSNQLKVLSNQDYFIAYLTITYGYIKDTRTMIFGPTEGDNLRHAKDAVEMTALEGVIRIFLDLEEGEEGNTEKNQAVQNIQNKDQEDAETLQEKERLWESVM